MSDKKISGFYYDIQKENKIFKVTLHANTKPPVNPYEPWYAWTDKSVINTNKKIDNNFPDNLKNCTSPEIDEGEEIKVNGIDVRYGKTPICSSIINEDFNISISNSWTGFEGGNNLQSLFNDVLKPLAPYATYSAGLFDKISSEATKFSSKYEDDSVFKIASSGLAKWSGKLKNASNRVGEGLSRSLIVQGTRFMYWGNTNIDFGNLSMRFTLFADYINVGTEDNPIWEWHTVDDQLSGLLPYAVGKYLNIFNENGEIDPVAKSLSEALSEAISEAYDNNEKKINENKNLINSFLGWQTPPAGFRANIRSIDSVQPGTLMLKIGPYYKLKNLAIQNLQLNYSKQVAKYKGIDDTIKTCPLFCDVTITFVAVTKYSDKMLRDFVLNRTKYNYTVIPEMQSDGTSKTYRDGDVERVVISDVKMTESNTPSIKSLEEDINKSLGLFKE